MTLYLFAVSWLAMAVAGIVTGTLFNALNLAPTGHVVAVLTTSPALDLTTWLDAGVLAGTVVLGVRFLRTGGVAMLRMMDGAQDHGHHPRADSQPATLTCENGGHAPPWNQHHLTRSDP